MYWPFVYASRYIFLIDHHCKTPRIRQKLLKFLQGVLIHFPQFIFHKTMSCQCRSGKDFKRYHLVKGNLTLTTDDVCPMFQTHSGYSSLRGNMNLQLRYSKERTFLREKLQTLDQLWHWRMFRTSTKDKCDKLPKK